MSHFLALDHHVPLIGDWWLAMFSEAEVIALSIGLFNPNEDLLDVRVQTYRLRREWLVWAPELLPSWDMVTLQRLF